MAIIDSDELKSRLREYLATQVGSQVRLGELKRYPVGFSWLTYGFTAAWTDEGREVERDLILRIGHPKGLFAPYSAREQFVALQALAGHGVPVPRVFWYSNDGTVLGGPFFIMERAVGEAPLPWVSGEEAVFQESERRLLAEQFVSALAGLHRFEWKGTAAETLSEPVSPAQAAQREVGYWEQVLRAKQLRSYSQLEHALLWLQANAPVAPRISVVHGDFRIGNFLVHDERITAILDWELVHLGDPHEDLGWVCMRVFRGRSPLMCHLITRQELYRRYQELSQIPVDPRSVHYYEVFGTWKLAVIHLVAVKAFEHGGLDDLRMPTLGAQVPRMLLQLERVLRETSDG